VDLDILKGVSDSAQSVAKLNTKIRDHNLHATAVKYSHQMSAWYKLLMRMFLCMFFFQSIEFDKTIIVLFIKPKNSAPELKYYKLWLFL